MIGFYYTTTLLLISLSLSLSHRHLCRANKITSAANTLQNDTNHDDEVISILSLFFSFIFNSLHPSKFYLIFDIKTKKNKQNFNLNQEKEREVNI